MGKQLYKLLFHPNLYTFLDIRLFALLGPICRSSFCVFVDSYRIDRARHIVLYKSVSRRYCAFGSDAKLQLSFFANVPYQNKNNRNEQKGGERKDRGGNDEFVGGVKSRD